MNPEFWRLAGSALTSPLNPMYSVGAPAIALGQSLGLPGLTPGGKQYKVGDEVIVDGKPKYYAGPDLGPQNAETYKKIFGAFPESVRNRLEAEVAGRRAAEGGSRADSSSDWNQTPTPPASSTAPEAPQLPEPEGSEPIEQGQDKSVEGIVGQLKQYLDLPYQQQLKDLETEQFVRRSLLTNALALRQSRESSRRQLELENRRIWRDAEVARIEANSRAASALAATAWASVTPNTNFMQALGEQYKASMAPFTSFQLK
jgi:hypothetical protein